MSLKAVLFDFKGVIINDEPIQQQLIAEILLLENLRPNPNEDRKICLGKSDRACLRELLAVRGRVVEEEYLTELIENKAQAYQKQLNNLEELPIYPGLTDFLAQLQAKELLIGLVTGSPQQEVELVLERANIADYFQVIVCGDAIKQSKPAPDAYLLAADHLKLNPCHCLALEDTLRGIEAAKKAKIQVVGVAHTYPLHLLQRQANWIIDHFAQLELEYVEQVFAEIC